MPVKRIFHNRQPRVGDNVVAISKPVIGGWKMNYEYEIVGLGHGYVVAYNERLGHQAKESGGIAIPDEDYRIFEDVYYEPEPTKEEKLKETHEYTYKFLGIPLFKRVINIYEENNNKKGEN